MEAVWQRLPKRFYKNWVRIVSLIMNKLGYTRQPSRKIVLCRKIKNSISLRFLQVWKKIDFFTRQLCAGMFVFLLLMYFNLSALPRILCVPSNLNKTPVVFFNLYTWLYTNFFRTEFIRIICCLWKFQKFANFFISFELIVL